MGCATRSPPGTPFYKRFNGLRSAQALLRLVCMRACVWMVLLAACGDGGAAERSLPDGEGDDIAAGECADPTELEIRAFEGSAVNGTRALCTGEGAPLAFCDRTEGEAASFASGSCNGEGIAISARGAPPLHGVVLGFEFDGDRVARATAHWEVDCDMDIPECESFPAETRAVLDGWIMPEVATPDLAGRQAGKVHLVMDGFAIDASYDTAGVGTRCDLIDHALELHPASSAVACDPAEAGGGEAPYRDAHDCMAEWLDYGISAAYVEWAPGAGPYVRSAYISMPDGAGYLAARVDVGLDEQAFPVPARRITGVMCDSLTDLGACADPATDLCFSCPASAERQELCAE